MKMILRKYQLMRGKWWRRQNYNLNTVQEAQTLVDLIRAYFPEVV